MLPFSVFMVKYKQGYLLSDFVDSAEDGIVGALLCVTGHLPDNHRYT